MKLLNEITAFLHEVNGLIKTVEAQQATIHRLTLLITRWQIGEVGTNAYESLIKGAIASGELYVSPHMNAVCIDSEGGEILTAENINLLQS